MDAIILAVKLQYSKMLFSYYRKALILVLERTMNTCLISNGKNKEKKTILTNEVVLFEAIALA